ncbi:MAG: hypothetical protein U1C74_05380 [Phenylobacterium sp.]|nr:hypothetical protein [Phenylobacterium sp.]
MLARMKNPATVVETSRTGSFRPRIAMSGLPNGDAGQSVAAAGFLTTSPEFCVTSNMGRALGAWGVILTKRSNAQAICGTVDVTDRMIGGMARA